MKYIQNDNKIQIAIYIYNLTHIYLIKLEFKVHIRKRSREYKNTSNSFKSAFHYLVEIVLKSFNFSTRKSFQLIFKYTCKKH